MAQRLLAVFLLFVCCASAAVRSYGQELAIAERLRPGPAVAWLEQNQAHIAVANTGVESRQISLAAGLEYQERFLSLADSAVIIPPQTVKHTVLPLQVLPIDGVLYRADRVVMQYGTARVTIPLQRASVANPNQYVLRELSSGVMLIGPQADQLTSSSWTPSNYYRMHQGDWHRLRINPLKDAEDEPWLYRLEFDVPRVSGVDQASFYVTEDSGKRQLLAQLLVVDWQTSIIQD